MEANARARAWGGLGVDFRLGKKNASFSSPSFTALHYAALAEKSEICRDLLDVDADVAAQDKNGKVDRILSPKETI